MCLLHLAACSNRFAPCSTMIMIELHDVYCSETYRYYDLPFCAPGMQLPMFSAFYLLASAIPLILGTRCFFLVNC
jgi:hypothetical protein